MSKSILIICYSFPPYPGTGGRRWLKFSKKFSARGWNTFVISAKNNTGISSDWINEIENNFIKRTQVNSYYPSYFQRGLTSKIKMKLYSLIVRFIFRENYFDRSVFWSIIARRKAEKLIEKNNIKNVILTAPPFSFLKIASKLKKKFPELNIIIDIRDILDFYTIGLSVVQKEKEILRLSKALYSANYVLSVADHMTDLYSKLIPEQRRKFLTITNGYDEADFANISDDISENMDKNQRKITMVYTGNLIPACNKYVLSFLEAVKRIKEENQEIYLNLEIKFFGVKEKTCFKFVEENKLDIVKFYGNVSVKEAHKEIAKSNFCLLFQADFYYKFALETKFFEYCFFRKPIVIFPEKGSCSSIIIQNNLGYGVSTSNTYTELLKIINDFDTKQFFYNFGFNIDNYSINWLTSEIEKKLLYAKK